MKTFDEAVAVSFTVTDCNPEKVESVCRRQSAFNDEMLTNEVLTKIINGAMFRILTAGSDIPAKVLEDSNALDDASDVFLLECKSVLYSCFMWGVTTGREMEKQDL